MVSLSEKINSKKKLFKLILGAGKKDAEEVKRITSIFAKAGADIFDVNPSREVLDAVIRAVSECGYKTEDFLYCVSYSVKGDIHGNKAEIDLKKCSRCGKCAEVCPEGAISLIEGNPVVDEKNCIGCGKCACDAISYSIHSSQIDWINFNDIVKNYPISLVELHIATPDRDEIFDKWQFLLDNFKGYFSICVNRSLFSDDELKALLKKMISMTDKERVFIQADGVPMSGGLNTYGATLQAVACAGLLADLGAGIFISGGTNERTSELAKICSVPYVGVSIGSYARKLIKDKKFADALKQAKKLVSVVKDERKCN